MKKIILSLLIIGFLSSCNNDDSAFFNETLNGKWNMVFIECEGCSGNSSYNLNDYTYTFDVNNRKVEIAKKPDVQLWHPAGTYDISLTNDELIIEPYTFVFKYYFEDNKLFWEAGNRGAEWMKVHFVRGNFENND